MALTKVEPLIQGRSLLTTFFVRGRHLPARQAQNDPSTFTRQLWMHRWCVPRPFGRGTGREHNTFTHAFRYSTTAKVKQEHDTERPFTTEETTRYETTKHAAPRRRQRNYHLEISAPVAENLHVGPSQQRGMQHTKTYTAAEIYLGMISGRRQRSVDIILNLFRCRGMVLMSLGAAARRLLRPLLWRPQRHLFPVQGPRTQKKIHAHSLQ